MNTEELIKPIKEKIKDTFASLIPEEQWEEMIKKEFNTCAENYDKQSNI